MYIHVCISKKIGTRAGDLGVLYLYTSHFPSICSIFVSDSHGTLSNDESYQSFDVKYRGSVDTAAAQFQSSLHGLASPVRRRRKEPSLVWALTKSFAGVFMIAAVFKLLQDLLVFASPQLLRYSYHAMHEYVSCIFTQCHGIAIHTQ